MSSLLLSNLTWSSSTAIPPTNTSWWEENGNSTELTEPESFPMYLRITTTIAMGIVLVIGITGNILVPMVIYNNRELRNSTNLFLSNLSIADLLVLLLCTPTSLVELHVHPEAWVLGHIMCKLTPFVEMSANHASILTITAISWERYYAICEPLHARHKLTRVRAWGIISTVWCVACGCTGPVILLTHWIPDQAFTDGTIHPLCVSEADTIWSKVYFLSTHIFLFLIPVSALVVLYSIIGRRLLKQTRYDLDTENTAQWQSRKQVVGMLVAVVFVFFFSLLPYRCIVIWAMFATPESLQRLGKEAYYNVLFLFRLLVYLNSAVNPIIYNMMSTKFREGFLKMFNMEAQVIVGRRSTITTSTSLSTSSRGRNSLRSLTRTSSNVSAISRFDTFSRQSSCNSIYRQNSMVRQYPINRTMRNNSNAKEEAECGRSILPAIVESESGQSLRSNGVVPTSPTHKLTSTYSFHGREAVVQVTVADNGSTCSSQNTDPQELQSVCVKENTVASLNENKEYLT